MKEKIEEFYNMLKLDRKKSAWSRTNTIKFRYDELKKEIDELGESLDKEDIENFKEELGDCLWDLLFLGVLAEEKNYFDIKEVIETSIKKLKYRKPWIFTGDELSIEEEKQRWKKAKSLENK